MLSPILAAFGLPDQHCNIIPFGSGLINHTWRIECRDKAYILQRINHLVFTNPYAIAANLQTIGSWLAQHHADYLFTHPIPTADGNGTIVKMPEEGYFRLFPFVEGSHTIDVVNTPQQAYEAAAQFGRFTRMLNGLAPEQLQITLPDFHNLSLRYQQFVKAVAAAAGERKAKAEDLIAFALSQKAIVDTFEQLTTHNGIPLRIMHHDTKISNVLFDASDKGLCVIDLDTVMPGYFISDVGDMFRTYLSPVSEEEKDFSKIEIREDYFRAIVAGYLSEMNAILTPQEKECFVYAGKFMIYMQCIRFLTDYLENDRYYGQKYEGHNLLRAANQAALLQRLLEKESIL